jgi:hypothetical protein
MTKFTQYILLRPGLNRSVLFLVKHNRMLTIFMNDILNVTLFQYAKSIIPSNVTILGNNYDLFYLICWRRDSAVGIATGCGLDGRGVGGEDSSPLHVVETGSEAHTASYQMGYGGSFHGGKSGRGVKLTTRLQLVPRSRTRGSIHPLPHTSSWRSA